MPRARHIDCTHIDYIRIEKGSQSDPGFNSHNAWERLDRYLLLMVTLHDNPRTGMRVSPTSISTTNFTTFV
jgi:hypothetical protein